MRSACPFDYIEQINSRPPELRGLGDSPKGLLIGTQHRGEDSNILYRTRAINRIFSFIIALAQVRLIGLDGLGRSHSSSLSKVYADDLDVFDVRKFRRDGQPVLLQCDD